MSDSLMKAFLDFVNDDTHTGEEADNSKAFVRERQIPLLIDITDDIQQLEELQEEIMAAFAAEVDNSPTAIIKTGYLDKVTLDFGAYEDALKEIGEEIESIAEELNATCSEVGSFMVPDYRDYFNAMETLVSNDGMSGIVPETKKKLEYIITMIWSAIQLQSTMMELSIILIIQEIRRPASQIRGVIQHVLPMITRATLQR